MSVLRVHFTADDLARTTIAAEPDPLWEVLLSLHQTQSRDGQVVLDTWRRAANATPRADLVPLRELAPPTGYSPDFLTPPGAGDDLDTALECLRRGRPGDPDRLSALVGATRAAALEAVVTGCTTSELARPAGCRRRPPASRRRCSAAPG